MDLVTVLEDYCTSLGWGFSYGNKSNNNLLQDLVAGKVYLILDPVRESEGISQFGGDGVSTFTGSFMLVVLSDLDNVYHTQLDVPREQGKYVKNILPLKENLKVLKGLIDCSEMVRSNWSIVDAIDVLDENMDGVIVTYTITNL